MGYRKGQIAHTIDFDSISTVVYPYNTGSSDIAQQWLIHINHLDTLTYKISL